MGSAYDGEAMNSVEANTLARGIDRIRSSSQ
jgi:hypothetical protein